MSNTPFVLIPGLNSTFDVFRHLVPALWPYGPVTVANHTEGEGIAGIAASILRDAPPRFLDPRLDVPISPGLVL